MRICIIFLIFIFYSAHSFSQNHKLKEIMNSSSNFNEICKKADKLLSRPELENLGFRRLFHLGKRKKTNLDNARMRYERWKWYWRDRLDENGNFPDLQRLSSIYDEALSNAQRSGHFRSAPNWKHEGPVRNTGGYWGMGRTTHIAFHPYEPNTFFVASPNGGLWKTVDGGKNYSSITENIPYQPVGIVVIDPNQTNTMYITLGEKEGWWQYGLGVYKTTNGGQTWTTTGLNWKLTDSRVIFALEMNPLNSKSLIAATSAGLYRTYNGGTNWTRIRTENFSDVKFKIGDTTTIYAAINDYWGSCEILKSTNAGNSWSQISIFNQQKAFLKLYTTPADPEYLAINQSVDGKRNFLLSKNSGANISFVSEMPENLTFLISPTNKNILYCGYVVLYRSDDGGKNWNQISNWYGGTGLPEVHADHHYAAFHPLQKNNLFFCCDGGIYRYAESANSFTELCNGLPISQFYKMAISSGTPPLMVMGSQDNGGFVRRTNGSWGNTNGGDAMWQLIDPNNSNVGYTEYWGGTAVYRTTNGFNSLTEISQNIPGTPQGDWVTPFAFNPKNTKAFFIGYEDIFVSYDRGDHFTKLTNNLTGAVDKELSNLELNAADSNWILAAHSNILYSSKDYGKTWTNTNLSSGERISDIEMHPSQSTRAWVTRSGLSQANKIFTTSDKGKTWLNITGNFINTPVLSITFDEPTNTLFTGTDVGVFYTDADLINWQIYGNNMPKTSITDLDIHAGTRSLYASTFGRGVYSINLPDCYPTEIQLSCSINKANFVQIDSQKVCIGDTIRFKTIQNYIDGQYKWTGPSKLDTTLLGTQFSPELAIKSLSQTGLYILQFTSKDACVKTDTIFLKVYSKPIVKIIPSHLYFDCNHKSITLSAGKDSIYTYNWNYGGITDTQHQISVNDTGTYNLKIKHDLSGCIVSDSIHLSSVKDPTTEYETTDVNCYGDKTGSLSISVKDGQAPYKIMCSNGDSTNLIQNLEAGDYFIIVTDANKCMVQDTLSIHQPDSISVNISLSEISTGVYELRLQVIGGTVPYTYLIEKSITHEFIGNDSILVNLLPDIYNIEIRDHNNCIWKLEGFIIKEPNSNIEVSKNALYLYPNPAKELLNVEAMFLRNKNVQIEVLNYDGKSILKKTMENFTGKYSIKLDGINQGQYLLEITSDKYRSDKTFKIIR